jgi:hypothetical protein
MRVISKQLGIFLLLSVACFFVYVFTGAWAHVLVPAKLFKLVGFYWYIGLVTLASALTTGLVFGYLFGRFFAQHAVLWALASAGAVSLVHLVIAFTSGAADVPTLSWIPILEAVLLLTTVPVLTYLSWGKPRAPSI